MLTIIFAILNIILGVVAVVMFTQPVFGIYNIKDGGLEGLDTGLFNQSVFDMIKFEEGRSVYLTVGAIALILALVFAGAMLIMTLINLITKATKNRSYVSSRWFALFFFIFMALATIMFAVYMATDVPLLGEDGWNALVEQGIVLSIGWGIIVSLICSFFSVIFAPGKNKG